MFGHIRFKYNRKFNRDIPIIM